MGVDNINKFNANEVFGTDRLLACWSSRKCAECRAASGLDSLQFAVGGTLATYLGSRTHLSLDKDSPEPRVVQPCELGTVVELPQVGGLHHRYERRAA